MADALGGAFYFVDVTKEADVDRVLEAVTTEHGVPRILINCAGIAPATNTLYKGDPQDINVFRRTIEVNLFGTYIVASRFAAKLVQIAPIDGERGVIVNAGSIAGFEGQAGQTAYASSKAAVAGLTLPLARDLAPYLIRVMTIAPGVFDTPMLERLPGRDRVNVGEQTPHPARLGDPHEFAILVEHIILNPMLNGSVIRLDGALRLGPY